jgi:hypothetical protein
MAGGAIFPLLCIILCGVITIEGRLVYDAVT